MTKEMTMINVKVACVSLLALACGACIDPPPETPVDAEKQAIEGVKSYVADQLVGLRTAAANIQTKAPAPDADGWNAADDAGHVSAMRIHWREARIAYESVEGAIAVLFPELDAATDERYDGFLAEGPDENLFDGEHVTGVHAIERILFADNVPDEVEQFESGLAGYAPAAFPATETEASDFKTGLAQRLVDDTTTMHDDFAPLALDTAAAYRGVMGSMEEQLEKVILAETGEDESRYAGHTLADMRANLKGGLAIYEQFEPMFHAKGDDGEAIEHEILEAFERVQAHYDTLDGDNIPAVPATWNPDAPSADDLATPYGELFTLLSSEADPANAEGLVGLMLEGADLLGIPQL